MRVIDHHDSAVLFREIAKRGHWADIAVHREHSVSDQQLFARLVFDASQLLFRMSDVLVAKN